MATDINIRIMALKNNVIRNITCIKIIDIVTVELTHIHIFSFMLDQGQKYWQVHVYKK